jgi:hypothetical protein
MIDLLHAVADGGDLIHYWDIAGRAEDALVRMKSRLPYATEGQAVEVAVEVAGRFAAQIRPTGYDVRSVRTRAQSAGEGGCGWHAFVEIVVS